MRLRVAGIVLGALVIPVLAHADSHIADYYAAYSAGGGGSTLQGFRQAWTKGWDKPKACKLGATGDVSVQFGSHADGTDVTQVIYTGGPRCTLAKHDSKTLVHVQGLLGGVYTNDGTGAPNDTVFVLGAAIDQALTKKFTKMTPFTGWGVRFEADRVFNLGDRESVNRYSIGVIYRFPH